MRNNTIALFASVLVLLLSACKSEPPKTNALASDEYYTCSMDPQVTEYEPGPCPICHMQMIKVKKHQLRAGEIRLSLQQQELANVRFDTIGRHETATELTLEGSVTVDQEKTSALAAQVAGRIRGLGVRATGELVHRGDFLYSIYSEDLNAVQAEYLSAVRSTASPATQRLAAAAKEKLQLYGMNSAAIDEITKRGSVENIISFNAPSGGYVVTARVNEGDYVTEGMTLFELADLSSLWVEAQVPVNFLAGLHEGDEATFTIPGSQLPMQHGRVIFIEPHLQPTEHFVGVRFRIDHPAADIRPGMLANISLRKQPHMALLLPHGSVLEDSHGASVWVLRPDGIFEIRMVQLGIESPTGIEITEGLHVGDIVVTSGAYLLNSEYTFKNGASPMAGMKM